MTAPMKSDCFSFRELPHTTKLFASFLENFDRVAKYYAYPPTADGLAASARQLRSGHMSDGTILPRVVEILRAQNARFAPGHSIEAATSRNLDRLASGAVALVTGQQVGLFLGPTYSIYKALSALRWAEHLTNSGIEAVPIFWLATEDHDIAEVNHVFWNTRKGLERLEWPVRESDAGRRVGEIPLGAEIAAVVARATENLEGPFVDDVVRALHDSYAASETFGSAFGKLMARLLSGRGMIFLDPLDSGLHRLAAPVYRRALDESEPLRDALVARSKELESAGLHAQVKVARESTLLFYNVDGRRQPLRHRNGKFIAGTASYSAEALGAAIESSPELFTPNVLLRPIVQDTLLPTAAYIGGPSEIAYMAQAQVVYARLLGRTPAVLPRASFTLIESPLARLLKKYDLEFTDLLRGRQRVRSKMEMASLPRGLARRFETGEKALLRLLTGYSKPLLRLDKTLAGARDTAERKILHQFLKLKSRAGRAENFRSGVLDRHERLLLDALCPERDLQERSLSFLPFFAAYGPVLLDDLLRLCAAPAPVTRSVAAVAPEKSCDVRHRVVFL
ncbi:MAG: bacillithiol biosynthesis cysteine-adding enzyme BshC [Candidatus Acidiferrales bacterium]